jgi:hypothetical protein
MLARAFHADYVWNMARTGHTTETKPLMISWRLLTKEQRAANESRADFILKLLPQSGFELRTLADYENESLYVFSKDATESLAKAEHERWIIEKKSAHWEFGAVRDDKNRRHPDLVPWIDLNEASKKYNRDSIRRLPFLLSALDLAIRPRPIQ